MVDALPAPLRPAGATVAVHQARRSWKSPTPTCMRSSGSVTVSAESSLISIPFRVSCNTTTTTNSHYGPAQGTGML